MSFFYVRSRFTPAPFLLPQKNHHPHRTAPGTALSDHLTAHRKRTQRHFRWIMALSLLLSENWRKPLLLPYTSLTLTRPGSAAPTRTSMVFFASSFRRAVISFPSLTKSCRLLLTSSTKDLVSVSDGSPPRKFSSLEVLHLLDNLPLSPAGD